jgi:hypothetical protein
MVRAHQVICRPKVSLDVAFSFGNEIHVHSCLRTSEEAASGSLS